MIKKRSVVSIGGTGTEPTVKRKFVVTVDKRIVIPLISANKYHNYTGKVVLTPQDNWPTKYKIGVETPLMKWSYLVSNRSSGQLISSDDDACTPTCSIILEPITSDIRSSVLVDITLDTSGVGSGGRYSHITNATTFWVITTAIITTIAIISAIS